jgi:hypothetical protein
MRSRDQDVVVEITCEIKCFRSRSGPIRPQSVLFQDLFDGTTEVGIVFDEQRIHCRRVWREEPRRKGDSQEIVLFRFL